MTELWAPLFYGALITMGVVTLLYFVALSKLLGRLREAHRETFVQLGEPSLLQSSVSSSVSLVKFILWGRYSDLSDARLRVLGATCRALLIIGLVAGILCVGIDALYGQYVK